MARQRGSNFSTSEKMLLTEMQEFEVIIEDKRTSGGVVIGRGAPLTFRRPKITRQKRRGGCFKLVEDHR